jgi:hypothetical protein
LQQIQESDNERDRNIAADSYMCSSTLSLMHDFKIRTARMEDHMRAHRIMTRVVARLMDFTLMWERDRMFMLVGMVYNKFANEGAGNCKIKFTDDQKIVLEFVNDANPPALVLWDNGKQAASNENRISDFDFDPSDKIVKAYKRAFVVKDAENDKDHQARKIAEEKSQQTRPDKKYNEQHNGRYHKNIEPKTIRNDLAHFNILSTATSNKSPLNLTYLINAVRSLVSYDRKLKNDVVRAVNNVLLTESIHIDWQLFHDRLKKPMVFPVVHKPLNRLKFLKADKHLAVPVVSPLLVSMVKALFDFDDNGYTKIFTPEQRKELEAYADKFYNNLCSTPSANQTTIYNEYWKLFFKYIEGFNVDLEQKMNDDVQVICIRNFEQSDKK